MLVRSSSGSPEKLRVGSSRGGRTLFKAAAPPALAPHKLLLAASMPLLSRPLVAASTTRGANARAGIGGSGGRSNSDPLIRAFREAPGAEYPSCGGIDDSAQLSKGAVTAAAASRPSPPPTNPCTAPPYVRRGILALEPRGGDVKAPSYSGGGGSSHLEALVVRSLAAGNKMQQYAGRQNNTGSVAARGTNTVAFKNVRELGGSCKGVAKLSAAILLPSAPEEQGRPVSRGSQRRSP